jgi:hypothetical protein
MRGLYQRTVSLDHLVPQTMIAQQNIKNSAATCPDKKLVESYDLKHGYIKDTLTDAIL